MFASGRYSFMSRACRNSSRLAIVAARVVVRRHLGMCTYGDMAYRFLSNNHSGFLLALVISVGWLAAYPHLFVLVPLHLRNPHVRIQRRGL